MRGLGRLAIGLAIVVGGAVVAAPSAMAVGAPSGCASQSVNTPVRTNDARVVPLVLMCSGNGGTAASVSIVTPPAHGTLTGPPETPLYTPSLGYTGPDQVTYRIYNAAGSSSDLTWPFQVTDGAGYPPQCFGSAPQYVRNDAPVRLSLSCFDENLKRVEISIVSPPQHGTLSTVAAADFAAVATALMPASVTSNASVMYTADAGYTGTDSFQIAGDDGHLGSAPATVQLTVTSTMNHAPICHPFGTAIVSAGWPTPLLATCADPDGDDVTITTSQGPAHGSVGSWSANWFGPSSVPYTPESGFTGTDSIVIEATDARGAKSATTTIPVTVLDTAPPPTINCAARLLAVTRNVALTTPHAPCFTLLGTTASASISSAPSHGTASITPAGALTYTPDRNYIGPDTLTLHSVAGTATLDTVVVISVTSNAKTTILSGPPATSGDTAPSFSLYGETGVTLTCALSNSSASTPEPCAGTKTYTGTPAGDHVLTVTATDDKGRTSTDTYAFTITEAASPAGGGGGGGGGGAAAGGSGGGSAPAAKGTPDAGQGGGVTEPSPAPAGPQSASAGSATAGQPAAAPPDPLGSLVAPRPKLRTLLKAGRITLPFTAPAPGRISVRWTVIDPNARNGRVLVAGGRARAPRAGDATVTVRLTPAGRALLRHKSRAVRISASATFRPDGAAAITRSATFRLR